MNSPLNQVDQANQTGQIKTVDITAIVLAGGKSTRMSGQDKGLVPLHGKPMIQWVIDAIEEKVSTIIISANQNKKSYGEFGYAVVPDLIENFQGPLAGMAAGLNQVKTKYALILPVDTPILPGNLVEQLAGELIRSGADLAVVKVEHKLQPAHLLLKSSLTDKLNGYLKSGGRRMQGWVTDQNHVAVSFAPDGNNFKNLNSEAELLQVETGSPASK